MARIAASRASTGKGREMLTGRDIAGLRIVDGSIRSVGCVLAPFLGPHLAGARMDRFQTTPGRRLTSVELLQRLDPELVAAVAEVDETQRTFTSGRHLFPAGFGAARPIVNWVEGNCRKPRSGLSACFPDSG